MLFELLGFHGDPMTSAPVNLMSLVERYNTDEHCREALKHLRFPDGMKCLKCQSENVAPVSDRKVYVCYSCRYQVSVTVGTIFHDTHLPLTTWYLCHRIRAAMTEAQHKMTGTVEIDETYVGGKRRGKGHRDKLVNKTAVIGIRERGGCLHFIKAD